MLNYSLLSEPSSQTEFLKEQTRKPNLPEIESIYLQKFKDDLKQFQIQFENEYNEHTENETKNTFEKVSFLNNVVEIKQKILFFDNLYSIYKNKKETIKDEIKQLEQLIQLNDDFLNLFKTIISNDVNENNHGEDYKYEERKVKLIKKIIFEKNKILIKNEEKMFKIFDNINLLKNIIYFDNKNESTHYNMFEKKANTSLKLNIDDYLIRPFDTSSSLKDRSEVGSDYETYFEIGDYQISRCCQTYPCKHNILTYLLKNLEI